MKRLPILLCSMLIFSLSAFAQEQKPETEPSLDESTHWLQEKITNYATFSKYTTYYEKAGNRSIPVGMTLLHKASKPSFDGCTFTFSYLWTETPMIAHQEVDIVQMGDIDSSKVSLKDTTEAPFFVSLYTTGGEPKIKKDKTTIVGARTVIPSGKENASSVVIPFDDKALAERVIKAFAHVADLCKKKKEPF